MIWDVRGLLRLLCGQRATGAGQRHWCRREARLSGREEDGSDLTLDFSLEATGELKSLMVAQRRRRRAGGCGVRNGQDAARGNTQMRVPEPLSPRGEFCENRESVCRLTGLM